MKLYSDNAAACGILASTGRKSRTANGFHWQRPRCQMFRFHVLYSVCFSGNDPVAARCSGLDTRPCVWYAQLTIVRGCRMQTQAKAHGNRRALYDSPMDILNVLPPSTAEFLAPLLPRCREPRTTLRSTTNLPSQAEMQTPRNPKPHPRQPNLNLVPAH